MSSGRLTPFSYVVLALIGEGGAGPHDLASMMRRGSIYWAAAESQWYGEPKRLEQLGYLRSEKRPGRTGPRTHYLLTPTGRAALQAWLAEASSLPRIQNEAIVRVLAGDLGDDSALAASLEGMRGDIARARANLDAAEAALETLPHRERYLRLIHRYGRSLLDMHEQWLDEAERELR
ncbi:MAG TPA: PadR family transcriptional regulator [Gaiellaceae bacterium]|nr:PadR family transcriptional regulator [Gaiellaceae bacterium]